MEVTEATQEDKAAWDDFVMSHPHSRCYQLYDWRRVFEEVFHCKSVYLMAMEGDLVVGVLPLLFFRSWLSGRRVTTPNGGQLERPDRTDAGAALVQRAKILTRDFGAPGFRIRQSLTGIPFADTSHEEVTSILHLQGGVEGCWAGLKDKVRNSIRKAEKSGVKVVLERGKLMDFYAVFCRNMRDLGTPVLPYAYFSKILEHFPGQGDLMVATLEERVLGGMLIVHWGDRMADPCASSDRRFFNLCPNDKIYWEAIKLGFEKGARSFDLGHSQMGSGNLRFKRKFGAITTPVHNGLVYVQDPSRDPNRKAVLLARGRQIASGLWRRLPLPVASGLGAKVRMHFPLG